MNQVQQSKPSELETVEAPKVPKVMAPIKQYVKYVGPKANIEIQFPIPFICKSAAQGPPITFYHNKPEPLTPDQAKQLCSVSGETFKMCDEQGKALKA